MVFTSGAADLQALSCHLLPHLELGLRRAPYLPAVAPLKAQQAPEEGQEATLPSPPASLH